MRKFIHIIIFYINMEESNNQLLNSIPLMNNKLTNLNLNDNVGGFNEHNLNSGDFNELNEANPYFIEFKNNIREWIKMDDDILTLNNALKEIKKKKIRFNTKNY